MHDEAIEHAGKVWEEDIIRYCAGLYKGHWLPSHDIGHHKRVWKNACLISSRFPIEGEYNQDVFFEQLIIACYFHDMGLLCEKGPRHGKESRRICEEFIRLHTDKIHYETDTMLLAIEHHDDKDYASEEDSEQSVLYQVLTLADDLDAFGAIGCYRYIEIYLMRNLESESIPGLILENATNRLNNFKLKVKRSEFLQELIQEKYDRLRILLDKDSYTENPEGLVKWINRELVQPQADPFEFLKKTEIEALNNERIRFYIEEFVEELSSLLY